MHIGIIGATSQIAGDLISRLAASQDVELSLYARKSHAYSSKLKYFISSYQDFPPVTVKKFDYLINFVGIGDPQKAQAIGASILEITDEFDQLCLNYIKKTPTCTYIFLSSGAAFGSDFSNPVSKDTRSIFDLNHLTTKDWYGFAKAYTECKHRALADLNIIDLRVYSYISESMNLNSRFFLSDILNAIRSNVILKVSDDVMYRDFLHADDFAKIIQAISGVKPFNSAIDCYSAAPISKNDLLNFCHERYGLKYEFNKNAHIVNATGSKAHYYSQSYRGSEFGYYPSLTSIQGVTKTFDLLLTKNQT